MLEVTSLGVVYGDAPALHDVTLDVGKGETVAILGPSGSGKTTLLRVVAGLQREYSGTVSWQGQDLRRVEPHERGFGLVFQDYALFPHLNVARNVEFGLKMRGDRDARRKVAQALEMVDLTGFEQRSVDELSGGEQQRVALARTLATEPGLILFDEPLGALDASLRQGLVAGMRALFARLESSVIYVTHDQEEALAIADRVAVMRSGQVVQFDTPEDVWSHPADEWTARFLGFSNIVPVESALISSPGMTGPLALIRPEALILDDHGPTAATVRSSVFAHGRFRTTIDVDGDVVDLFTASRLDPGVAVRVRVDPAGVIELS